jgi:hypothetical protein
MPDEMGDKPATEGTKDTKNKIKLPAAIAFTPLMPHVGRLMQCKTAKSAKV